MKLVNEDVSIKERLIGLNEDVTIRSVPGRGTLMLKEGIHPKIVSERLGHSSVAITLDTYSHVLPGIQAAAARRFDEGLQTTREEASVRKVS